MNKEEFYKRLIDIGLDEDTLNIILNKMLNNEEFNSRTFSLPDDKKVLKVKPLENNDNSITLHNILLFKTLVRNMIDSGYERFQKFGIDKELFLKIKSLSSDELIDYFKNSKVPRNDRSLVTALPYIKRMSLINDVTGSHSVDFFEDKSQETKFKKDDRTVNYTKRIYLNLPLNKIAVEFLTLYKLRCFEKGIPSKMKGMGSDGYEEGHLDTTILYSNDYYLLDHINILESIIKERPDLVNNFGSPVISGARFKSNNGECYYTISSGLLNDNTSNSYYDRLYKISFIYLCSKYVNIEPKFDVKSLCEIKKTEVNNYLNKINNLLTDEIKTKIINENHFKEVVQNISSYLRFGDLKHLEVPLYQDEIFMEYLKDVKNTLTDEENYLNHTEEIFENIKLEFLESNKNNTDRVLDYKNSIDKVIKTFRNYSVKTKGFVASDRYKEVINYIKTLPDIKLFVNDKTKGDGINFVNSNRYYDEIATKLETTFNKKESKKI